MSLLPGFESNELAPQAERLAPKLRELAEKGVQFGTSSWKYDGWLGTIYSADRYQTRGKFSNKKFESECLEEYGRVFPTVCGDFAFYQFPTVDYWRKLFGESNESLTFALKVPEDITVATWPKHARYGDRAGAANSGFLDFSLYQNLFLKRLEPYQNRLTALIFEFGTFNKSNFANVDEFLHRLDHFLAALPKGFRHAVEIRNPEYLGPGYFSCLAEHGVAHVYNAWTRMPELSQQIELPGADTADFSVVRALLKKGRAYETAVKSFEPYRQIAEPLPETREALAEIANRAIGRKKPAFLYVNTRLEGPAPSTIEGVAERILAQSRTKKP